MILRMRELAVQMENGIYTAKDRDNAQLEVNALLSEIDKIANNTRFNDVAVLDGSYDQTIRAGNTNAETIRVAVGSLKAADTSKITEFAVEKAVVESDAAVTGTDAQRTALGRTGDYNHATNFDTAQGLAIAAAKFNLSDDGADGVDASGTDTDLTVRDGADFKIDTSLFSTTFKEFFKADSLGTFTLATAGLAAHDNTNENVRDAAYDTDAEVQAQFQIDAKTGEIKLATSADFDFSDGSTDVSGDAGVGDAADIALAAQLNFWSFNVVYTKRDGTAHNETINLAISQATETNLSGIEVETSAKATRSIETLNKALEEVSTAQAKLGAIQNRLTHNIDNLSKGSMLTEQSVGRIVDADLQQRHLSYQSSRSWHRQQHQCWRRPINQSSQF
jgi:flagellin